MKTEKDTKCSLVFDVLLNESLFDLELEIMVEQVCEYLDIADNDHLNLIVEGFRKEYKRRKDLDWYHSEIIMSKKSLMNLIIKVKNSLEKRGVLRKADNRDTILKKFFVVAIDNNTAIPVRSGYVNIDYSEGELARVSVGIGVKPQQKDSIVGPSEDIDWSDRLNTLFGSFSNIHKGFSKEAALV